MTLPPLESQGGDCVGSEFGPGRYRDTAFCQFVMTLMVGSPASTSAFTKNLFPFGCGLYDQTSFAAKLMGARNGNNSVGEPIRNPPRPSASTATAMSVTAVVRQKCVAGIALRCRAFVTVMQAAEVRNLDDRSDTRELPNLRTLFVQS